MDVKVYHDIFIVRLDFRRELTGELQVADLRWNHVGGEENMSISAQLPEHRPAHYVRGTFGFDHQLRVQASTNHALDKSLR